MFWRGIFDTGLGEIGDGPRAGDELINIVLAVKAAVISSGEGFVPKLTEWVLWPCPFFALRCQADQAAGCESKATLNWPRSMGAETSARWVNELVSGGEGCSAARRSCAARCRLAGSAETAV